MRRSPVHLVGTFLAAATVFGAAAVGCGSSGRDLRPPVPNAVSPTRSTSPASQSSSAVTTPPTSFTLTSTAFPAGGPIPAEFSCEGPNPDLSWSGVPEDTAELALAVVDLNAGNFVHWLVTGIPPATQAIAKGQAPAGAKQLPNSKGTAGWTGPCPPAGSAHTYNFVLLALPEPVAIPAGTPPADAFAQLQAKAEGRVATLTGVYAKA